jgi:hypothetical protein
MRGEKKRTCIGEKRAIKKRGIIISNILEKLSGLIILNSGIIIYTSRNHSMLTPPS